MYIIIETLDQDYPCILLNNEGTPALFEGYDEAKGYAQLEGQLPIVVSLNPLEIVIKKINGLLEIKYKSYGIDAYLEDKNNETFFESLGDKAIG